MENLINRIFRKKGKRLTFEQVESFLENFAIDLNSIKFPKAYCSHMEFSEIKARLIKKDLGNVSCIDNPSTYHNIDKTYIEISGVYHAYNPPTKYYRDHPPQNPRFYRNYPFSIVNGKLNLKRK